MNTKVGPSTLIAVALLFGPAEGQAQKLPGLDTLRKGLDKISVQKLLEGTPPITTTLTDAVTEVAFIDDFEPSDWFPLGRQPRGVEGEFRLGGGAFVMELESYCLRAGSYAPGRGDGYLYAPLKGPRAKIVYNVLRRAQTNPQIPQRQIQALLWAILAHTKVSDMSGELLLTAKAMLTPAEIYEVNGGALGLVPRKVLDQAIASMSPALRPALEAEAMVRSLASQGDATYEQLERAAVLVGEPRPGPGSREVPRGRWSYNPAGHFTRYLPQGYPKTVVWVYAPERFAIETDGSGAITSIAGPSGWRLVVEYDNATPASVAGAPGLAVRRMRSVSMELTLEKPRRVTVPMQSWQGQGWILLETAPRGVTATAEAPDLRGLAERSRRAATHHLEIDRLGGASSASPSDSALGRIHALAHLRMGFQDLSLSSGGVTATVDPAEFVTRAWMSEVGRTLARRPVRSEPTVTSFSPGLSPFSHPRRSGRLTLASWVVPLAATSQEDLSDEDYYFTDLSDGAGQPGNTSNQRVGLSNRGTKRDDTCAGEYAACKGLAFDDWFKAFGTCIPPGGEGRGDPECYRQAQRDFNHEFKNCATIAKHCLGP